MKHAALVLMTTLALGGTAYAQAWPNATPSPYGSPTVDNPTAAPAPSTPAVSPPSAPAGIELGVPPRALGASAPNAGISSQTAPPGSNETPVPDVDNPNAGRATSALNVLEAQGYASFSDFRPDGNKFTALVSDNGQQFRVVIDPDTGQISRQ